MNSTQPNYEANAFLWGMQKSKVRIPGLKRRFDEMFGLQPDYIVREHLSDERIAEVEDSALAFIELMARTATSPDERHVTDETMLDVILDSVYHLALLYADQDAADWMGLKQTPLDALAFASTVSSELHGVSLTPATETMSRREVCEAVGSLFMRAAKGFPVSLAFAGND